MSDVYGCLQERFKCTCGTYLILMDEKGIETNEIMKCHGCGKVYDFEISLTNPRFPNDQQNSGDGGGSK